jgi:nucleoside-diphosphate-sugar epimerase
VGGVVISADVERPTEGSLFPLLNGNRRISTLVLDLAEPSSIDAVAKEKPEVIFHLAAIPYGPATSEHRDKAFRSNVASTFNMLEAAKRVGVERFVLASSACYFGAAVDAPLTKTSELVYPEHFYTYTKRHAEGWVRDYHEFGSVPATICRFVNIYGPGDRHFGRIIPCICRQLIEEKSDTLRLHRSDGQSIFEFLYVEDAVDALLTAASDAPESFGVFHFGPGPSARLRIQDLVGKLSVLYDGRVRTILTSEPAWERRVRKYLDISETEAALGWAAQWGLEDGLGRTLNWYRSNMARITPHTYR